MKNMDSYLKFLSDGKIGSYLEYLRLENLLSGDDNAPNAEGDSDREERDIRRSDINYPD